jgi:hypothetical protein
MELEQSVQLCGYVPVLIVPAFFRQCAVYIHHQGVCLYGLNEPSTLFLERNYRTKKPPDSPSGGFCGLIEPSQFLRRRISDRTPAPPNPAKARVEGSGAGTREAPSKYKFSTEVAVALS